VVRVLALDQWRGIWPDRLLFDGGPGLRSRHLSYRFALYSDGAEALAVKRAVMAGSLPAGPSYPDPI
jgi:hypothetical protein